MIKHKLLKEKKVKVYCPVNFKTDTTGYWIDNGKLYKDNLIIQSCNVYDYHTIKKHLFDNGELAVFSVKYGKAHIEDKKGIEVLKNRKTITSCKRPDEKQLILLCEKYGGLTVFKKEGYYIIDVWTK